jgi:hypothetical protein
MTRSSLTRLLMAAGFIAAFGTHTASAQNSPYHLTVQNSSQHAVWVTTYVGRSSRDTILAARCYLPGQGGGQTSGNPTDGGWVLFEIKREANTCANHGNLKVLEQNVKRVADIKQTGDQFHIAFR